MRYSQLIAASILLLGTSTMNAADNKSQKATSVAKATFAGGCFWCMQPPLDAQAGVISTVVGYEGGNTEHPTYEEVSSGRTGHLEAIEVVYDPKKVTYNQLLDIFWRQIDPTQVGGQFADHGSQYVTAVFYHNEEQKKAAELSKKNLNDSGLFDKPIVTAVLPAKTFWPAEEYHQKYYLKKTLHYKLYKQGSGREAFIEKKWGKDTLKH
jgi:methionine-S-sulfoxide reductase